MNGKIKLLREQAGMNQTDLAQRMGVTPSTVCRWESGEKRPDLPNLLRLADIFGVSLDYLMGREERDA